MTPISIVLRYLRFLEPQVMIWNVKQQKHESLSSRCLFNILVTMYNGGKVHVSSAIFQGNKENGEILGFMCVEPECNW